MFVSLRDKLNTVQEGIAARLQSFSEPPKKSQTEDEGSFINFNAGANLLHKYQTEWSELHEMSESNGLQAQELDIVIGTLDQHMEKQWNAVTQMSIALTSVPQILTGVQELMEQIGQLQQVCEDVESALLQLEDTVEMQALQERQLDHRFQLAMYKEKKLAGLEALRSGLVLSHSNKLLEHELRQQQTLKERQATFDEAFKQDVAHYKKSGSIPRLGQTSPRQSLEEVVLDPEDDSILDKFLQEDSSN